MLIVAGKESFYMMKNIPVLSPRLKKIAELVPKCGCVADIGTDHAYLPVYLLLCGECDRAIASDVKKGPLERAKKTIFEYGVSDGIEMRLGGGLDTLGNREADAVVIAGMGGLLIAKILEEGKEKLGEETKIILQPMTAVPELREYLCKNGWTVARELLVKEDNKIYNIMEVQKKASGYIPTEAELYLGKYLMDNKPEFYEEYLQRRIKKLRTMAEGMSAAVSDETKVRMSKVMRLLDEISVN